MKIRLFIYLYILLIAFTAVGRDRADSTLMQYLQNEGLTAYPYRDVQVYKNGKEKFAALFQDIDNAKHHVWVEYMIVANDSIGNLTLKHLEMAAKRGCEVRLIIDDYKDRERHYGFRTQRAKDSIRSLGIDFNLFDRFHYPWFNHVCRDHRKIVVIDDSIGYIGGLNIADYYLNGKPRYGGWRDIHSRVTGPGVEGLANLFQQHYKVSGGKGKHHFARYLFDEEYKHPADFDQVVYFERSRITPKKQAETRNAFIAAFDAAQDTLRIVSPYFLPTHTVRQALMRAIDRGVYVEIMFSKVGDNDIFSYGNFHFAQRLVRHGAHVYLYKGEFHHSKIFMIDSQVAMIGSANMNSRSLKWDYEASAFYFSQEVTAKLNQIFADDKSRCDTFSLEYYKKNYGFGPRAKGWFINRFMTPIL